MNTVFTAIFLISACMLSVAAPQKFLSALIGGVKDSAATALALFCIYAVWMGLSAVAEKCGITKRTAKLFQPLCFKIFRTNNAAACEAAAMNITCNLLGAGASTPFGVKAVKEFEKDGNFFAQKLLFIINCAGLQLIPSTAIALRASFASENPADIFLPCLICSLTTLVLSVALFLLTEKLGVTIKKMPLNKNRVKAAKPARRNL